MANTHVIDARTPRFTSATVNRGEVSFYVRDEALQPGDTTEGTDARRPVLLLHGTGLDHTLWEPVADRLIRSGIRVIRTDMRGHGRSAAPESGYDLASLAADVIAVLDELGVDQAHVVGHSLGGTVGTEVALSAPQRVASVTTLGALIAGQPPPDAFLAWAGQLFEMIPQGLDALRGILPDTAPYAHQLIDPDVAAAVRHVASSSLHAERFLPENFTDLQAIASGPVTPWTRVKSGALDVPLMTIDGSEDPVVSGLAEKAADLVPGARGVVLHTAGHLALVEQPVTVARHLREFIADAETARALRDQAPPS